MAKSKDRVVILCVVFNFGEFIGLKVYNIDRKCENEKDRFQDVFKNELYLYDIWGLSEESKKYLYRYKKLKDTPILSNNIITKDFHCSKDFKGYRDLPQIDIGTGFYSNVWNQAIAFSFDAEEIEGSLYSLLDYINRSSIPIDKDSLYLKRCDNLKITNITNRMDEIVSLFEKIWFLGDVSIYKNTPKIEFLKFKKLGKFKEKEQIKEYRRRIDLLLSDAVKDNEVSNHSEGEERKFIRDRYLNCSKTYAEILRNNGLGDILQNKKDLSEISYFIDMNEILKEIERIDKSPCNNSICNDIIFDLKEKICNLKITLNKEKVKYSILKNKYKLKDIFIKSFCEDCHTMQRVLSVFNFIKDKTLIGYGLNLENNKKIFINITNKDLFSLEGYFTLLHEYTHYLSFNNGLSGFANKNDKNTYNCFGLLVEGLTEILACYMLEQDINTDLNIKRRIKNLDKINLYLKDLNTLKSGVIDILDRNMEEDFTVLNSYKYNVFIVCKIMRDIGVKPIIDFFFYNNNKGFEILCEGFYGRDNWSKFIIEGNKSKNRTLTYSEYFNLKSILGNIDKGGN